jgi:RNA polymerase sigma factor (TIGR02999 family)
MGDDRSGNATAPREPADELLAQLYQELKVLARQRLARLAPGQSLSATDLVHEAYARLVRKGDPGWHGRPHFFGAAARAMREIVIERARQKAAKKALNPARRVELNGHEPAALPPSDDVLAIHEAVEMLEDEDPRKGEIVNLRFFAGMTVPETAEALGISVGTVEREWRFIRPWLYERLKPARSKEEPKS